MWSNASMSKTLVCLLKLLNDAGLGAKAAELSMQSLKKGTDMCPKTSVSTSEKNHVSSVQTVIYLMYPCLYWILLYKRWYWLLFRNVCRFSGIKIHAGNLKACALMLLSTKQWSYGQDSPYYTNQLWQDLGVVNIELRWTIEPGTHPFNLTLRYIPWTNFRPQGMSHQILHSSDKSNHKTWKVLYKTAVNRPFDLQACMNSYDLAYQMLQTLDQRHSGSWQAILLCYN